MAGTGDPVLDALTESGKVKIAASQGGEAAVETPITPEPPKSEERPSNVSTTTPPDFDKWLSEQSDGKLKSVTELKDHLSRTKDLNPEEVERKISELEAKANIRFADPYVERLNDWITKGGTKDTFDRIHTVDPSKLDDLQAVTEKYLRNSPHLTPQEVDALITEEYKLGDEFDDKSKSLGKIRLKNDGHNARTEFTQLQEKYKTPPESQAVTQNLQAWEKDFPKVLDDFKTVRIPYKVEVDGKQQEKVFSFTVDDKTVRTELADHLRGVVEMAGIPHNEDGLNAIRKIAKDYLLANHAETILQTALADREKELTEAWKKKIENPSGTHKVEMPSTGGEKTESLGKKALGKIMELEQMGI